MGKVYVRTKAYNAERTIRRAIESVLGQTHGDFVYYILDNASTDGTGRIIEEYARRDARIVAFRNAVNNDGRENRAFWRVVDTIGADEYFCLLDADDAYAPTFLADMLAFMDAHRLDIACCGSDVYIEQQRTTGRYRALDEDMILAGRAFARRFPEYLGFLRTTWGKLFKGHTAALALPEAPPDDRDRWRYGGDTHGCLRAFAGATRVGIRAGVLHTYTASARSSSHRFERKRLRVDALLFEESIAYLARYGPVDDENRLLLLRMYLFAIRDTLRLLFGARISMAEKVEGLHEVLFCDVTRELVLREDIGRHAGLPAVLMRTELFAWIVDELLGVREVPDDRVEAFCACGAFASAAADRAEAWLFFQRLRARFLVENRRWSEAGESIRELEDLLPGDAEVAALRRRVARAG